MYARKSWDDIKQNPELAKNVKLALKDHYDCDILEDEIESLLYFQPDIFTKAVLKTAGVDFEE